MLKSQPIANQALAKIDFRNLRFSPPRILARCAPHSAFSIPAPHSHSAFRVPRSAFTCTYLHQLAPTCRKKIARRITNTRKWDNAEFSFQRTNPNQFGPIRGFTLSPSHVLPVSLPPRNPVTHPPGFWSYLVLIGAVWRYFVLKIIFADELAMNPTARPIGKFAFGGVWCDNSFTAL